MSLADKLAGMVSKDRRRYDLTIGDDTITLFSAPLTGADIDRVMKRHPKFAESPTIDAIVDLLILKAEDENGDKAFTVSDKPVLRRLPVTIIHNIRAALLEDDEDVSEDRIEDDLKN